MSALVYDAAFARTFCKARSRGQAFTVELASDWASVAAGWTGAATPFQDAAWLGAWYAALGDRPDVAPLLVTIREAGTGELALRLPLIRHRTGRLDVIAFADLHLTDNNAPVLGPAAPRDREGALALWRALRRALPRADLVHFTKMPLMLGERPNPLGLLPGLLPSKLNGNLVQTGEDWNLWRRSLGKVVRKELDRSWRVFTREPGAAFEVVTEPERLRKVVAAMEAQQQERMRAKGLDYILAEPEFARFYRDVIDRGVPGGNAVVTALTAGEGVGEEIVAALLCVRDAQTCVMLRISIAGGRWTNCSPGRLIVDRTIAALHAQGCRVFDLSVGNYDYKRRFGVRPVPLVDMAYPLRLRGVPAVLRAFALGELRRRPALEVRVRAMLKRS